MCPILYSGDEIGQVNDYSYKEDPNKCQDSRYIHRGAMNWKNAEKIRDASTVEGKIFSRLSKLEQIRRTENAFVSYADTWTIETWDQSVLCMGRYYEGDKIMEAKGVMIPAYSFLYLKHI